MTQPDYSIWQFLLTPPQKCAYFYNKIATCPYLTNKIHENVPLPSGGAKSGADAQR